MLEIKGITVSICPGAVSLASSLLVLAALTQAPLRAADPPPTMPYQDVALIGKERDPVAVGATAISILRTYFWRDWMPVVAKPGPDGGSPLRGRLQFWVDNTRGPATSIAVKIHLMDEKGRTHPVSIRVEPNYRVFSPEVMDQFQAGDLATREKLMGEYRLIWDGTLEAGEARVVEFGFSDGPYLPARSRVRVEVTWTEDQGRTVLMRTPASFINRTD